MHVNHPKTAAALVALAISTIVALTVAPVTDPPPEPPWEDGGNHSGQYYYNGEQPPPAEG